MDSESDRTWISGELDELSDALAVFLDPSASVSSPGSSCTSRVQDVYCRLQKLFLSSHTKNYSSIQSVISYLELLIKNLDIIIGHVCTHSEPSKRQEHFYEINYEALDNVILVLEGQDSPLLSIATSSRESTTNNIKQKNSAKLLLEILVSSLPVDDEKVEDISRFIDKRIISRMKQEGDMVCGQYEAFEIFVKQFPQFSRKLIQFSHYFGTPHVLGKGSYAIVYLGFSKETGKTVAIKRMEEDILSRKDPSVAKKLKNEELIMKSLSHQNIVRLFDTYRQGGTLNLVLEYCGGGTLGDVIESEKQIPEKDLRVWLSQIANGLKYLRDRHIVHRDLKPHNIMISDGIMKLTDFTYARHLGENELAETYCGTPLYMAPEILGYRAHKATNGNPQQNNQRGYSDKSDLWSLGIISFQLLYGKLPWAILNWDQLFKAIFETPVTFPDKNISPECHELISGLLKKDPEERITWNAFFSSPFLKIPADTASAPTLNPSPTPSTTPLITPSTTPSTTPSATPSTPSATPSAPSAAPSAAPSGAQVPNFLSTFFSISASSSTSTRESIEKLNEKVIQQQERIKALEQQNQELQEGLVKCEADNHTKTNLIKKLEDEKTLLCRQLEEAEALVNLVLQK